MSNNVTVAEILSSCPTVNSTLITGVVDLATSLLGMILALFTILLNSTLLYAILTKPVIRPLNALIANLCIVSILSGGLGAVYISGLDAILQNLWMCSVFSFLRNVGVSLISLSVLSISYERVRKVAPVEMDGKLLLGRVIGGIWVISFIGAIPALFVTILVHHTHSDGEIHSVCMKAPPGDYFDVGLIYEVIRSLVFHVGIPIFMMFELYRIRATLKHFFHFTVPCPRMRRRVRRVRFIYINSITFVLLWVPFGVGISIYKNTTLQKRYERFVQHPELDCEDRVRSNTFYILVCLFYCYILLLPVLIFYSNDTFSSLKLCHNNFGRENKKIKGDKIRIKNLNSPQGGEDEITRMEGGTTFAASEPIHDECHTEKEEK
ncbi:uncharacterized protein LOC110847628 isoform X1 [Folsomia candida]|uniref:uncharacterized protein LOC110847628 isoform X1 n=1 Tax=Folsomia candida TaxID=158441 RepID=UPI001604F4EB|nr:uncharacterized protein LOC110847628 isoform X1 [Folsomia candida]